MRNPQSETSLALEDARLEMLKHAVCFSAIIDFGNFKGWATAGEKTLPLIVDKACKELFDYVAEETMPHPDQGVGHIFRVWVQLRAQKFYIHAAKLRRITPEPRPFIYYWSLYRDGVQKQMDFDIKYGLALDPKKMEQDDIT